MVRRRKLLAGAAIAGTLILAGAGPAMAASITNPVGDAVVHDGFPSSPSKDDSWWYREDTNAGATVTLTREFGAPPPPQELGDGALKLTTNDQNSAHGELVTHHHVYGELLSNVSDLSYWTYHSSTTTGFADANAAIDLKIDLDGDLSTTADQTTLVYETYWNDIEGTDPQHAEGILPDVWQFWDTIAGGWWTTHDIACGPDFFVAATAGGPPNTRPGDVANNCPNAKIVSLGISAGDFNPNYVVAVDGVHFETAANSYTWDFGPK
jgi:hypothetical protein